MEKSTTEGLAPSQTQIGRMELMLEDVQSQVRMIAESVVSFRAETQRAFADLRRELLARIELLELVVRQNSADIRELRAEQAQMREEIAELRRDVQDLRGDVQRLEERVAGLEVRVAAYEPRFAALESRGNA